eukprot:TRINITY_DN10599_c0_g1_i1.p1 TRINITY_DN10599_c0_g1~~TRINITY_DN10599_c0_g1_i1.p1  ORF type:complete len:761 (+),score=104.58 TRINITY_DN10599_c0_g1_i1:188-2470(+)
MPVHTGAATIGAGGGTDAKSGCGVDALFAAVGGARRGGGASPEVPIGSHQSCGGGLGYGSHVAVAGSTLQASDDFPSAEALSLRYRDEQRLWFADRLISGFCDHAPEADVVVDVREDQALQRFLERCQKKLQKVSDPVTALMVMGLLVSEHCGRSGMHAEGIEARLATRFREARAAGARIPIGSLLGDTRSKHRSGPLGAGLSRQRALLLKFLASTLGTPECTLERDDARGGLAWNTVQLDHVSYVLDLIHDPGALYESGSPKQLEYVKFLSASAQAGVAAARVPLCAREDLLGRVPRPPWHVEASDLTCTWADQDRLGKGGFGEVFRGTWAGETVALKVVAEKAATDYDTLEFVLEIALLARLSHPNVIRLWRGGCAGPHKVSADDRGADCRTSPFPGSRRPLVMVLEHVDRGSLSALLHGHGGRALPEPLVFDQTLVLAVGIVRGMCYLHACKVLHLDLKSPNILVGNDWTPKLCDFGLAKIRDLDIGDGGHQTTLRGVSLIWAPPEMINDHADDLTDRADVYSCGLVLFELVTRQLPFQELKTAQLQRAKFDGVKPRIPPEVPQEYRELISTCAERWPSSRPSMEGVATRLDDIANVYAVDMSEVCMPAWLDEDGIGTSATGAVAAAALTREAEKRHAKLEEEHKLLQRRLEGVREQMRRIHIHRKSGSHGGTRGGCEGRDRHSPIGNCDDIGIAIEKDDIEPLLFQQHPTIRTEGIIPTDATGGSTGVDNFAIGGSALFNTLPTQLGDPKRCCRLQ